MEFEYDFAAVEEARDVERCKYDQLVDSSEGRMHCVSGISAIPERRNGCGRRQPNTRIAGTLEPSMILPRLLNDQELSKRILRSADCELSSVTVKRCIKSIEPPQRGHFHSSREEALGWTES